MVQMDIMLEKVDKFCYFGDMLDADGGCTSAVAAKIRCAWKSFVITWIFVKTERSSSKELSDIHVC